MLAFGKGVTVIVTALVFEHPLLSVPVTVYLVVIVGEAIGFAISVAVRPGDGDHLYDLALFAVICTENPLQIVALVGVIVTGGNGFTVTVTFVELLVHVLLFNVLEPVTVYVVVTV